MNRMDFAPRSRLSAPSERTQAHLVARRRLQVTPAMLASLAALGLSAIYLVGPLGVLLFLVSSAALISLQPLFNLRQLMMFSPLLLFPFLAILSTIWSDAPQKTMRDSIELLITFAAAIVICRNVRPDRLILILFGVFLALSLLLAPYVPVALATKAPLFAWMGSKNQVGTTGYQLFALSLGVLADRRQPLFARLISVAAAPLGLLIGYVAQSGGTTSSVVLFLLVFPPLAVLGLFKRQMRTALVVIALGLLVTAGIYHAEIEAAVTDFRVTVLNKDATLTGRTYLWDFANRLSSARPTLGYGYAAFWRQGNIDAEGLWRWGGIPNRTGFNFHNAFVGTRVDLGLVGLTLFVASLVGVAAVALFRQITRPQLALACLIALTLVNYVRSFVEEGLISSFNLITVIWLATAIYAFPASSPVTDKAGGNDRRSLLPRIRALGSRRPSRDAGRRVRGTN